jgi:hypothetical protein
MGWPARLDRLTGRASEQPAAPAQRVNIFVPDDIKRSRHNGCQ